MQERHAPTVVVSTMLLLIYYVIVVFKHAPVLKPFIAVMTGASFEPMDAAQGW